MKEPIQQPQKTEALNLLLVMCRVEGIAMSISAKLIKVQCPLSENKDFHATIQVRQAPNDSLLYSFSLNLQVTRVVPS